MFVDGFTRFDVVQGDLGTYYVVSVFWRAFFRLMPTVLMMPLCPKSIRHVSPGKLLTCCGLLRGNWCNGLWPFFRQLDARSTKDASHGTHFPMCNRFGFTYFLNWWLRISGCSHIATVSEKAQCICQSLAVSMRSILACWVLTDRSWVRIGFGTYFFGLY